MSTDLEVAPPTPSRPDAMDAYIVCDVAGTAYAVDSREVEQLEMLGALTPVPNSPPYVDGVTSSRGKVVPVVNLRARFGFPRVAADTRSRIIVTRTDGRTIGLLVDSAREFARIPADTMQRAPDALASAPYLRGVAHLGERLVLVVDVRALLGTTTVPVLNASPATGALPAAL